MGQAPRQRTGLYKLWNHAARDQQRKRLTARADPGAGAGTHASHMLDWVVLIGRAPTQARARAKTLPQLHSSPPLVSPLPSPRERACSVQGRVGLGGAKSEACARTALLPGLHRPWELRGNEERLRARGGSRIPWWCVRA